MSSRVVTPAPVFPERNYLNETYGIRSWLLTTDHKRIALLYLASVTFFFFIGGFFAMMIRLHLLTPSGYMLSADTYNRMFTMHGVAMIFFFLIPAVPAVLGNFLIPLMIGAKDLAFPKINLLSWYVYVVGGTFTLWSMVTGGLDTGWTFYTPLSTVYSNSAVAPAVVGIFITGFSSILTGLNFLVTVHTMRAPGMTWFRLPLFVWAHYATAVVMILGTPVVAITLALAGMERLFGLGFFNPAMGGDPILFQHLFWFYSHPAVYIMILPAMGVISELIATFARKKLFGYSFVAAASLAIAVIGFLVWTHHMFVTGQSTYFADFLVHYVPGGDSIGGEGIQLDGNLDGRIDLPGHADVVRVRVPGIVPDRWIDRAIPGLLGRGHARSRYVFRRGPFPLHHGGRRGDGIPRRIAFLVAEDDGQNVSGMAGAAGGGGFVRRIQPDIFPAVRAGIFGNAAQISHVPAGVSGVQRDVDGRSIDSGDRVPAADDLPDMGGVLRKGGR